MITINRDVAKKVLEVVDCGLVQGMGDPIPGQMCMESSTCYALDLPHGDDPECVNPVLLSLGIRLNDADWSSNASRSRGLRRLALAQLGSAEVLDTQEFIYRIIDLVIRIVVPRALHSASKIHPDPNHAVALEASAVTLEAAAVRCEITAADAADAYIAALAAYAAYAAAVGYSAARAASAYAYASVDGAADAAIFDAAIFDATNAAINAANFSDSELSFFAEEVVKILIDMKAPGCQWLDLAPLEA